MTKKWCLRVLFILLFAILLQTSSLYATDEKIFKVDEESSYTAKFNCAAFNSNVKKSRTDLHIDKRMAKGIVAGNVARSFVDKILKPCTCNSIVGFFTELGCEVKEEFYEDVSRGFGDISIYKSDQGTIDDKFLALIHITQWKKSRSAKLKDVEITFPEIFFEWFSNPQEGAIIRFGKMNKVSIIANKSEDFLVNATILKNKLATGSYILHKVNVVYKKGYFEQYDAQLKN